jgi:hypothetical protein
MEQDQKIFASPRLFAFKVDYAVCVDYADKQLTAV